jgi:hypothetical protein
MRKGEERLVTPRLSRLNDGRLVVLIDQDDWGHFHEDQPSGILAYWSTDDGATWSKPQLSGAKGFEPDRMLDLPDGSLGFGSHCSAASHRKKLTSSTSARTAGRRGLSGPRWAHDGFNRVCEGAVVLLSGGELACVLRDSYGAGRPSYVTFSKDNGHTWSKLLTLPFSFHRPYAKQLPTAASSSRAAISSAASEPSPGSATFTPKQTPTRSVVPRLVLRPS